MGNKVISIVSIVANVLLALAAATFAFQANKIAEMANTIAEKHYSSYYETSLPHITAILQEQYDETSETRYEIISILAAS